MVAIDNVSGDVRFHLSYGGIIAIGFILLMALAIAFIAVTRTTSTSASTDSLDTKPTQANAPVTSGMMAAVSTDKPADPDRVVMPDVLS